MCIIDKTKPHSKFAILECEIYNKNNVKVIDDIECVHLKEHCDIPLYNLIWFDNYFFYIRIQEEFKWGNAWGGFSGEIGCSTNSYLLPIDIFEQIDKGEDTLETLIEYYAAPLHLYSDLLAAVLHLCKLKLIEFNYDIRRNER